MIYIYKKQSYFGGAIMKLIQSIINLIIFPLTTLIFLTVGFIAALLSALIEYSVLKDFFTSSHLVLLSGSTIALLLVFTLEFTKLFLHIIQNKDLNNCVLKKSTRNVLSIVLVFFSFLCSIIFTITTLYLPTYNSNVIDEEIAAIDTKLAEDIRFAKEQYDEEYNSIITPYLNAMNEANKSYTSPAPSYYSTKEITLYQNFLSENLAATTTEYNDAVNKYTKEKNDKITTAITTLTSTAEQEKENLKNTDNPETALKYDNPVLSSFLTVLSMVFFNTSEYSRDAYFWCCIIIGLIISSILEAIISVSMQFLNAPMHSLITTSEDANDKIRSTCHEIVITSFKSLCAFATYLFLLSFKEETLLKTDLLPGIFAIAISVFLTNHFLPKADTENNKLDIYYKIRECLLQGILSLTGFIFLGFLFGNEALTLNLNTIGIGIGSALSGGIIQLPKLLINKKIQTA